MKHRESLMIRTSKFVISLILFMSLPVISLASDPAIESLTAKDYRFQHKFFRMRILPRSPNQIAAFYEARGFPQLAIEELRRVCFITTVLGNRSGQQLYHDLSQWEFSDKNGPVKRILRPDWKQRWEQLGLEKRFQSTFRWTLMPEKLDFYPQEGEGGNLIFPRTENPITIKARFQIGKGDRAKHYEVTFKDIKCATDKEKGNQDK
jgi:hypothetical protein